MGSMGKRHCTSLKEFFCRLAACGTSRPSKAHRPWPILTLVLPLFACEANPTGLQGRWTGAVNPVSGTCDPPSQAILTIRAGGAPPYAALFSPTSGVLTLQGTSDGTHQVDADLHAVGMNHQPYVLAFSGTKAGDTITGTYVSQRCRAEVTLHRE